MNEKLFQLEAYDYVLPQELIAQHPVFPKDHSRLLIVNRQKESFDEIKFCELADFLNSGDSFVFNDTKVIPARLLGKRESGGVAEIFLSTFLGQDVWEVLARPGKKLKEGSKVYFADDFFCEILHTKEEGTKIVRFYYEGSFESALEKYGQIPLPHYIRGGLALSEDRKDYQTVYAKSAGAVAAPTAGLHFTSELLERLATKKILNTSITLHVGLGTFKPVQTEDIRMHQMHTEPFSISKETASFLNQRDRSKRQISVGTTCCRALESAIDESGLYHQGEYKTEIFIYPGYQFKAVESLLTNFHAPKSSLLMLVSAFAGYELMMEAYQKAVKERFRFHSYGDAMLII